MNIYDKQRSTAMPSYVGMAKQGAAKRATMWIGMTEWLIVLSMALSGLFLADPFFGGWLARASFAKVLTFGSLTVALTAHLLARATFAPAAFSSSAKRVFSRWWPIVFLAILIIAGSVYGIKVKHIKNNFLNFGLSMLFLPAMAIAIDCSDNVVGFLKWLGAVYLLTVLAILIEMPISKSTHHEEIFIAIPLGLYFLGAKNPKIWEIVLGFGLVGLCGFSVKNTTFIMMAVALMVALGLWVLRFSKIKDGLKSTVLSLAALIFYCGSIIVGALAWYKYKDRFPHGNTEYRLEMYRIAWEKFLDSPFWGTGFSGETVSYFRLYKVEMPTQYLPTHSDIIDILANGGIIGITLWLLTVANVFIFLGVAIRRLSDDSYLVNESGWRAFLVMSVYQLCALITYAVNPPLINPVHGFWVWGGLAVTWALWRYLNETSQPVATNIRRP